MATEFDFDVLQVTSSGGEQGPYEVSPAMKRDGWPGGLWVKFLEVSSRIEGNSIIWKRILDKATPLDATMFVLRGSYEPTDHYTGRYPQKTGVVTTTNQGQFFFRVFETVDLAERTVPGSGAPLVYALNELLYVSSNGLLTSEQEGGVARRVGYCTGTPDQNNNYLGAEILFP